MSYISENWVSRTEVSVRIPQGFKMSFSGYRSQWKQKVKKNPSPSLLSIQLISLYLVVNYLIPTCWIICPKLIQLNIYWVAYAQPGLPLPAFSTSFSTSRWANSMRRKGPYFEEVWELSKATSLAKLRNEDFPWNFTSLCPSISH